MTKPRWVFLVWGPFIQSKKNQWWEITMCSPHFTTSLIVEMWHESPSLSSQGHVKRPLCGNAFLWPSYEKAQWEAITCKWEDWKNIYTASQGQSYYVIMSNEQQNLSPRLQIKQLSLLLCSYNSTWTSCGAKAWLSFRKQILVFIGWFVSKSCASGVLNSLLFSALPVWKTGKQITKINFLWYSGANSLI